MAISVEALSSDDLRYIGRIDRSETVEAKYVARIGDDGRSLLLVREPLNPPQQIPPWTAEGAHSRCVEWQCEIKAGGVAIGAFDTERARGFVGFSCLGQHRMTAAQKCPPYSSTPPIAGAASACCS